MNKLGGFFYIITNNQILVNVYYTLYKSQKKFDYIADVLYKNKFFAIILKM